MTFILKSTLACLVHLMMTAFILSQADAAAPPHECGKASWYELTSRTASGEMADPDSLTAAHPSLPFGSMVRVVNQKNGWSVTVRINDRGPFVGGRIIDVTRAAALKLGFRQAGIAKVCVHHNG